MDLFISSGPHIIQCTCNYICHVTQHEPFQPSRPASNSSAKAENLIRHISDAHPRFLDVNDREAMLQPFFFIRIIVHRDIVPHIAFYILDMKSKVH